MYPTSGGDDNCDERLNSLSSRISNIKMQCQGYLQDEATCVQPPTELERTGISPVPDLHGNKLLVNNSSGMPLDLHSLSPSPSYLNTELPGRVSPYNISDNATNYRSPNLDGPSYPFLHPQSLSVGPTLSATVSPVKSFPQSPINSIRTSPSVSYPQPSPSLLPNPNFAANQIESPHLPYMSSQTYSQYSSSNNSACTYDYSAAPIPTFQSTCQVSEQNGIAEIPSFSSYTNLYGEPSASNGHTSNLLKPASSNSYISRSSENLLSHSGPSSLNSINPHYSPYFKETVEELGPEEYRWFYKTESDKKWIPFIGYDSLRIEWKFRDLQQNGVSGLMTNPVNDAPEEGVCGDADERPFELGEEGTVTVRGGLYEVDVKQRKGQSIYWRGEVFIVSRGTWFYEGAWTPLEEQLSQLIEIEHLTHFRGQPLDVSTAIDSQKQVVHRLDVPGGAVEWFSASEIYLSLDATPARLMRSVGKKLGFQKTGYKIHRGYSEDASASDKPPDITHLVFVIHGIGQKMDTGRIIKNSTSLRENVNNMKQRYMRDSSPNLDGCNNTTVEFFPVEWRSALTLDNGLIDCITPHKILNIRQMLNASFMDIMYYNSPQYREEIVTGLSSELNRLYGLFTDRNPYFEPNGGQVSVVAHSLGCVITYDIITGWSPVPQLSTSFLQAMSGVLGNQMGSDSQQLQSALQQLLCKQMMQAEQPNLNFKISNFFCLGSPLAVFLALRWKKSGGNLPMMSKGRFRRMLNIFHPSDPVAYRLEPLLAPAYSTIAPTTLHLHSASDKVPYSQMPLEPLVVPKDATVPGGGNSCGAFASDGVENLTPTSQPTTPVKGGSSTWNLWGLMKGGKKSDQGGPLGATPPPVEPYGAQPSVPLGAQKTEVVLDCGKLSESERIDFVLREGSMESSYISALTSHTSYWTNLDVAHFLLTILYPDLQTCTGHPHTTANGATAVATATANAVTASSSSVSSVARNDVNKHL